MIIISCSNIKDSNKKEEVFSNDFHEFEVAVLVEGGIINDNVFNQSAWEGVLEYAKQNDISYEYYKVAGKDIDSYINTIKLSIENGAKLIIMLGYNFSEALYKVQDIYTNTHFVILDGVPKYDNNVKISSNVHAVLYAEEEAGFLAGYAAVKEGYTNLGIIGGMEIPPIKDFSYGFMQGADYAAYILKITNINIKYGYFGNYYDNIENEIMTDSFYKSGVQIIFAPAGGAVYSVIRSAEKNNGFVIGVDLDQTSVSKTVITSATKIVRELVYNAVCSFYNNENFMGGQIITVNAKINGIGLPMMTSRFKVFTKNDYDDIYEKIINKRVKILKSEDINSMEELPLKAVKVY